MNLKLNLSREQQFILLGLIVSIVVGLGVMAYQSLFKSGSGEIVIEEPQRSERVVTKPQIVVHISGAVRREGVYRLNSGERLLDVIKAAGGALPSADLSAINLAEPVKDGEKVIVPTKQTAGERVSGELDIRKLGTSSSKVNINTADEKTLDTLPGIGPATARAIIEYRKTNGPFTRVEQIMEIPRFGRNKFEKIKNRISVM